MFSLNILQAKAATCRFDNYQAVDPNVQNWYYAEIYVNDPEFCDDSFTNTQAQGTLAHEIGHTFGFKESSNKYSIMCQIGVGRMVHTVQKIDNDNLNIMYP